MNKYVGKICPYCKAAIKEGEQVVVCSACEMPHHLECWIDNQGCTTFACPGTISAPKEEKPAPAEEFEITLYDDGGETRERERSCPACGAPNAGDNLFCCKCGSPLGMGDESAAPAGLNILPGERDLPLLIGPNQDYYLAGFRTMGLLRKKTCWNWSAFLFAPFWLIYRKMYGYGAALLGGIFLLSLFGGWFASLLTLGAFAALGLFGSGLYLDFLNKKAARLRVLTGSSRSEFAAKNGGTNQTAAIAAAVGFTVLAAVIRLV